MWRWLMVYSVSIGGIMCAAAGAYFGVSLTRTKQAFAGTGASIAAATVGERLDVKPDLTEVVWGGIKGAVCLMPVGMGVGYLACFFFRRIEANGRRTFAMPIVPNPVTHDGPGNAVSNLESEQGVPPSE